MTQLMSFVAFPAFLGSIVLAPELFTTLFGPNWTPSVIVFQILIVVALIESISLFNGSIMMALGKPEWKLRLNLLNAVVNVIGFAIAVRWGIEFVALAYVLRTYILSPLPVYCVKKLIELDIPTYLKGVSTPLACSIMMALLVYWLKSTWLVDFSDISRIVMCAASGAAVYSILSFILNPQLVNKMALSLRAFVR